MGRNVTWLHLSDIHLRVSDSYNQAVVIDSLLKDIESICVHGNKIEMVFLTGDIAFSGKNEEFAIAREFVKDVSEASKVPLSHVFCVPGNHDVSRDKINALSAPPAFPR